MKKLLLFSFLFSGCAVLNPNSNALIVRVEQTESIGYATVHQLVLADYTLRSQGVTNSTLYNLAQWFRQPYIATANGVVTNLPRGQAIFWTLDQLKLAYKSSLVSSNDLITALSIADSALSQAQNAISQLTSK